MKLALLTAYTAAVVLLFASTSIGGDPRKTRRASAVTHSAVPTAQQSNLFATRMMLIDRKKALREQLQKSMPLHEEKLRDQSAAHEIQKDLYEKNLISKAELENSAQALVTMQRNTERIREWIAEDEHALSLAEEAEDNEPRNGSGGALVRYDGAASWSLSGLEKINLFFRERFGRSLPVSALGQSHTHNRLGLDHRESVDVAVRPDSVEGRDLMAYLRRSGIPFLAFRGKLSSVSTGAHIHIGRPSPRLEKIKQQVKPAEERREKAERS